MINESIQFAGAGAAGIAARTASASVAGRFAAALAAGRHREHRKLLLQPDALAMRALRLLRAIDQHLKAARTILAEVFEYWHKSDPATGYRLLAAVNSL